MNGARPLAIIARLMTFDACQIRRSKQVFRQRVAAKPIEQKLAMLDALRERALIVRQANPMARVPACVRA